MVRNLLAVLFFVAGASLGKAEIMIGVAGPMSGQFSVLGNQMKAGVEAAVKAINITGGINGEPLTMLVIDDGCDTRRAVEAAKEFVAKDARAIIGHYCSGTSLAAALVYKDAAIPMITPTASAPQLTEARHWNVFRMALRDDALAALAGQRIVAFPPPQNPVIVGDGQANSLTLFTALKAVLPDVTSLEYKSGPSNIATLQQQLATRKPQSVILALPGAEAAGVLALLTEIGFTGRVYGNEAFLSEDFTGRLGSPSFDIIAVLPADPVLNPFASPVRDEFALQGQSPDGAALPAYAATQIFVSAAKATSVNDGKAVAQWLAGGQPIDTTLGRLSFTPKGDLKNPFAAWYIWNGQAQRFLPE
jgi:branched-chain amino acid transport system substrate-binding protein